MAETTVLVDLRCIMEGEPREFGPLQNAARPGAHELLEKLKATHTRVVLFSPLFHKVEWTLRVGSWLSLQQMPKHIGLRPMEAADVIVSDYAVRPEDLR